MKKEGIKDPKSSLGLDGCNNGHLEYANNNTTKLIIHMS